MTNGYRLLLLIPKAMLALCFTGWVSPVYAQNLLSRPETTPPPAWTANLWKIPFSPDFELVVVNGSPLAQSIPGYGDFTAFEERRFMSPRGTHLQARFPVQAWLESADGPLELEAGVNPWPLVAPSGAWFEVSNKSASESFLVRLENSKHIDQAREQIRSPGKFLPRRLIAVISKGGLGFNRNLRDPLKRSWSWEVSSVSRFADYSSIDCDGSPSQVEQNLDWWLGARFGQICFWNYQVVRELPH